MKTFQEIFSEGLDKSDYDVPSFAKLLDLTPNYVWQLRKGDRTPSRKTAARIASELYLNLKVILDSIEYQKAPNHLKKDFEKTENLKVSVAATKPKPAQTKIPLVAYVSAGEPFECDVSEFERIDLPVGVRPDEAHLYYAVRVRGDSMLPFLKDGATLIIRRGTLEEVISNDLAIYRDTDNNCWVKQVQFINDSVVFNSFNPAYPPIIMQKKDIVQMERVECVIF